MSDSAPDTSADAGTGVPRGDDPGYPVVAWHDGQPVPDLARVPRERWREIMLPLTVAARRIAVHSAREPEPIRQAGILATELELFADPPPRRPAQPNAEQPNALPRPAVGDRPRRESARQVNFRLGQRQYARLSDAADLLGARPSELARLLTMRGVEQMLWEERSRR